MAQSTAKHRVLLDIPPRIQWTHGNGYCGEMCVQSIGKLFQFECMDSSLLILFRSFLRRMDFSTYCSVFEQRRISFATDHIH